MVRRHSLVSECDTVLRHTHERHSVIELTKVCFRFLWPCIVSKVWRERKKPTRCNNQMFIINFCLNMFRASLCPSSGEQRPCYCILLLFCLSSQKYAIRCPYFNKNDMLRIFMYLYLAPNFTQLGKRCVWTLHVKEIDLISKQIMAFIASAFSNVTFTQTL